MRDKKGIFQKMEDRNAAYHDDVERSAILLFIVNCLKKLHKDLHESVERNGTKDVLILKRIRKKEYEFFDLVQVFCLVSSYRIARSRLPAWDNYIKISFEESFIDAFHEVIVKQFQNLVEREIKGKFSICKLIYRRTGDKMIDFYRKEKRVDSIDINEILLHERDSDEDLESWYQLNKTTNSNDFERFFKKILPKMEHRILFRWRYLYRPSEKDIAKAYGYTAVGSVKSTRGKYKKRLFDVFNKIELEMWEVQVLMYKNSFQEGNTDPMIEEKFTQRLNTLIEERNEPDFFDFIKKHCKREKEILLRWSHFLEYDTIEQANVYECPTINKFYEYRDNIITDLSATLN